MTTFRGFRVPPARCPVADYGAGWFFVTVVTAGRVPWLCRIRGGRIVLTPAGGVVAGECVRTGALRPGVVVDAFVVMPDHVHLIVGLGVGPGVRAEGDVGAKTPQRGVSTNAVTSNAGASGGGASGGGAGRPWRPGVLGAVVGHIKGASTKRIRASLDPAFAWQTRFHDVIIRDERHLDAVRRYIEQNPAEWERRHRPHEPVHGPGPTRAHL